MSGELTDSRLTSAEVDGVQATKVAVGCPFGMPEYQVQVGSGLLVLRDCFLSGRVSSRDLPSEAAARPTDA